MYEDTDNRSVLQELKCKLNVSHMFSYFISYT